MSRRFGRNQRRKLREELMAAEMNVRFYRNAWRQCGRELDDALAGLSITNLFGPAKEYVSRMLCEALQSASDEQMRQLLKRMRDHGIDSASIKWADTGVIGPGTMNKNDVMVRVDLPAVARAFNVDLNKLRK